MPADETLQLNLLAWMRRDEMSFRADGSYDAAVQAQRCADLVEEGFLSDDCKAYQWFDRGKDVTYELWEADGLLQIRLPSLQLVTLTRDECRELYPYLCNFSLGQF